MFPYNPLKFIILPLLFFSGALVAQDKNIPIGQWRTHSSFNATSLLAYDGDKVYAAPSKRNSNTVGTFFSIDKDGEIKTYSKEDGLSEYGVAQLGYSENAQVLVVAYENGNLDFIKKDGSIINLNDIKTKEVNGLKTANHLFFYQDLCIISYDFGICVLDLKKFEVKETISKISNTTGGSKIRETAIANGRLYAISDLGIFSASFSATTNLMDVNNWSMLALPFDYDAAQNHITSFKNQLFIGQSRKAIYRLEGSQLTSKLSISNLGPLNNLSVSQSQLQVTTAYQIINSVDGDNFSGVLFKGGDFFSTVYDKSNSLWATTIHGLVKSISKDSVVKVLPNSPYNNSSFKSYYNPILDEMVVVAGAFNPNSNQADNVYGYYVFKDGQWSSFSFPIPKPNRPKFIDIVEVVYHPTNKRYYFASFGWGMAELNPIDSSYIFYDTLNSSFKNVFKPGLNGMRVNALAVEDEKLWVGTHVELYNDLPMHLFTPNSGQKLKSKSIEISNACPYQIIVDSSSYKWIRHRYGSTYALSVYDSKTLKTINLPMEYLSGTSASTQIGRVFCMELDRKGQMWVGTDKGIAIISETSTIFNYKSGNKAYRPIYEGFPLLYTEQILSIQVDGANRKWIGTNNGVWLLSEDGSEVISRFTTDNSPLLSNKVSDIEIMGSTGEVFFSTEIGLISYRGSSTLPNAETSGIKIFPSPVTPDYLGLISINGLPSSECTVKITDEFGGMIHELKSTGGSAIWNGKNYNGGKAKSGMYLVFTADKDGTKNFVGKFAIVE